MRVAWVDDEPSIRFVARRMVELSGNTCIEFEDHASLLASMDGPFDAAILQPSDALRADDVREELRRRGVGIVLLVSGSSIEGLRRDIDVDAFDRFLEKPISHGQLREALGLSVPRVEVPS